MLIDKVQSALGTKVGVDLVNTNGNKLHKDLPIEESGLEDGSTITALLAKTVPTVLKNKGGATAELKADGTVACTGLPHAGGDCHAIQDQLVDVQHIYSTNTAFAALKAGGSVVSWGHGDNGGDCSKVQSQLVDVQHMYSTKYAFAALKAGGSVVAWGGGFAGGDCSKLQGQLASDVQHIYATEKAFAALKADGAVVLWGKDTEKAEVLARSVPNQVKPTKA